MPIMNENYGKQMYPLIKREVNPNEYKKTSSYRAILSGHQRHQGKIVGIETTMKPRYLPRNNQQYSTPYGYEAGRSVRAVYEPSRIRQRFAFRT